MKALLASMALTLAAPLASAVEIEIGFGPEMGEDWADTYGAKERDTLAKEVREDLLRELKKRDIDPARVSIKILEAKPNKPTMEQLGDNPGLDFGRSVSIGGMSLEGVAYDAEGNVLLSETYKWFEHDIRDSAYRSTWGDARRASDRFARKFSKDLAGG